MIVKDTLLGNAYLFFFCILFISKYCVNTSKRILYETGVLMLWNYINLGVLFLPRDSGVLWWLNISHVWITPLVLLSYSIYQLFKNLNKEKTTSKFIVIFHIVVIAYVGQASITDWITIVYYNQYSIIQEHLLHINHNYATLATHQFLSNMIIIVAISFSGELIDRIMWKKSVLQCIKSVYGFV